MKKGSKAESQLAMVAAVVLALAVATILFHEEIVTEVERIWLCAGDCDGSSP